MPPNPCTDCGKELPAGQTFHFCREGSGDAATPGQLAYEEDVRLCPNYDDGAPRCRWDQLPWYAQQSWEQHPVPRAIHIYRGASR